MSKEVTNKALFENVNPLIKDYFDKAEYPWELLPKIRKILANLIEIGLKGYQEIAPMVFVEEGVFIAKNATIIGPCIIGKGTEIRPNAYIRGDVFIGENCIIGNATELKNSILLDNVNVPHYNYVGDSILGSFAHMGAGAVCSNVRSDNKDVIIHGDVDYPTHLWKVGAFLGDHVEIGCGAVLNPGVIIGKDTSVYPLTSCRGVYPKDSIIKSTFEVIQRL